MKFGKSNYKDIFIILAISLIYYLIVKLLKSPDFCFFKLIYGIPCPGCGSTRALYYLFKFNIKKALYYHPLILFIFPLLLLIIFHKNKFFISLYKSTLFWFVILCIYIGAWIIRLILMFPDTPPMDYNYSSVCYRIYEIIKFVLSNNYIK